MGVAAHLKIDLADYDRRIRTFIPWYEEMLDAAADALALVDARAPAIIDLGTGTGALAERCLRGRPRASLVGIDGDPEILAAAERRLRTATRRVEFIAADFERAALPAADAIVGSLSLHHIPTGTRKRRLYRRAFAALRRGGMLVSADCCPAADRRTAGRQHAAWRAHLLDTYDRRTTAAYFRAWAREDHYVALERELAMMRDAGFRPEVLWRRGPFAVIAAMKAGR